VRAERLPLPPATSDRRLGVVATPSILLPENSERARAPASTPPPERSLGAVSAYRGSTPLNVFSAPAWIRPFKGWFCVIVSLSAGH
jgi:hypothetical protein